MTSKKRKSIFELERRTDLVDDLESLLNDFNDTKVRDSNGLFYTVEEYLDSCIVDWPYRQGATSINSFLESHGIDESGEDITTTLLIFETYINLLHFAPKHNELTPGAKIYDDEENITKTCCLYLENITYFLEQGNYSVRTIQKNNNDYYNQYVIYKRDANVDAALECAPKLAETLLSYLDIRNSGNEEFKRTSLKVIADYLEPIRKVDKYKGTEYNKLCDTIFMVFNKCNIRHNNPEFKKIAKKERIKIYDATFKMSVHLLQFDDVQKYKNDIPKLEDKLKKIKQAIKAKAVNNKDDHMNKEKKPSSTDIHITIDPSNPKPLTPSERAQLDALSNLPDDTVRKKAESDPDCEPLE